MDYDKEYEMVPFAVRWKGVFFVMRDINNSECSYKLLKPIEPDLRRSDIKSGNTEYYVALKSKEIFNGNPIQSWRFNLRFRQHILPIPNVPWFNKKEVTAKQPDGKDLYFDDSLFQKISPEEKDNIIKDL